MADDSNNDARSDRSSDAPTDLVQEREAFVRTFLKKGVEFTEQLLHENTRLREENARLQQDNARLRAQVASDDAIRDLLRTIEGLENEKQNLLQKSEELERTQQRDERRYQEIETELNDLANLYIASQQLHAGLSVRRVIRQLCDILAQFVGARSFVIYALEPDGKHAVPIGSVGLDEESVSRVPVGEGAVGDACLTGVVSAREESPLPEGQLDEPLAVIPLMVDGRTVGAVSILSLLEQKEHWASIDQELFNLLSRQAGLALIAANLYADRSGPLAALADVRDRLK